MEPSINHKCSDYPSGWTNFPRPILESAADLSLKCAVVGEEDEWLYLVNLPVMIASLPKRAAAF